MTKPSPLIAVEILKSLFFYNRATGVLRWKRRPRSMFKNQQAYGAWNTKYAGKPAGYLAASGYLKINLLGKTILASRICFSISRSQTLDDDSEIDHRDRNTTNNRPKNIRKATRSQNACNMQRHRDRIYDLPKNVDFHAPTGRYRACIQIRGKTISFGYFQTPEIAAAALIAGRAKYHGKFTRHS